MTGSQWKAGATRRPAPPPNRQSAGRSWPGDGAGRCGRARRWLFAVTALPPSCSRPRGDGGSPDPMATKAAALPPRSSARAAKRCFRSVVSAAPSCALAGRPQSDDLRRRRSPDRIAGSACNWQAAGCRCAHGSDALAWETNAAGRRPWSGRGHWLNCRSISRRAADRYALTGRCDGEPRSCSWQKTCSTGTRDRRRYAPDRAARRVDRPGLIEVAVTHPAHRGGRRPGRVDGERAPDRLAGAYSMAGWDGVLPDSPPTFDDIAGVGLRPGRPPGLHGRPGDQGSGAVPERRAVSANAYFRGWATPRSSPSASAPTTTSWSTGCSADPDRLIAVTATPFWDVELRHRRDAALPRHRPPCRQLLQPAAGLRRAAARPAPTGTPSGPPSRRPGCPSASTSAAARWGPVRGHRRDGLDGQFRQGVVADLSSTTCAASPT